MLSFHVSPSNPGVFIKDVEAKDVEASKTEPSAEGVAAAARPPSPGAVSPSSPTPQGEPEAVPARKEQGVGWVKLAKLVHGEVPPTVAELQLEGRAWGDVKGLGAIAAMNI